MLRFPRLINSQKRLLVLVLVGGLTELTASILVKLYGANLPLYHLYVVVEFSLITIIFDSCYPGILPKGSIIKISTSFLLLALLNIVLFQPLNSYASHTRTLESVLVLSLAIRYFYLVLKELKVKNLEKTFAFWFSTGILIYFSANLLLFIYSNFIVKEDSATFYSVWAMHGVLNILLYLFYAVALWQKE